MCRKELGVLRSGGGKGSKGPSLPSESYKEPHLRLKNKKNEILAQWFVISASQKSQESRSWTDNQDSDTTGGDATQTLDPDGTARCHCCYV